MPIFYSPDMVAQCARKMYNVQKKHIKKNKLKSRHAAVLYIYTIQLQLLHELRTQNCSALLIIS